MHNAAITGGESSSPREPPTQALTEPYMNLSIHAALIIQPLSNTNTKWFRLTIRVPPILWLTQNIRPDNGTPLLRCHYSTFPATTVDSVPVLRIGTLILLVSPLGFVPYHQSDRFPSSIQEPVSNSCHLYAGCHLDGKKVSSRLIPATLQPSGFDNFYPLFDTSSVVHSRSSLGYSPDPVLQDLFLNAHYHGS
jgi:hypothetical protein